MKTNLRAFSCGIEASGARGKSLVIVILVGCAMGKVVGQVPDDDYDHWRCNKDGGDRFVWVGGEGGTCMELVCNASGGTPKATSPNTSPDPCLYGKSESGGCYAAPQGLAGWRVTEPSINLWLQDNPLQYKTSRGRLVRLVLSYKNRLGTQGTIDNAERRIFSFGSHWFSPWRSYLETIASEPTNYWAYLGSGGAGKYTSNQVNYATLGKLWQISGTNVIQFAEGDTFTFGLTTSFGGVTRHFLTRKEDANGNATMFEYVTTADTIRLDKVIDVDHRSITFEYAQKGDYSNVVTKVLAPHGLTNLLYYDGSGRLTNITDSVGLSSRFQYDATNLTALITPYGTNTFTYFSIPDEMHAIKVTELGIKNHLYLYKGQVDGAKVPSNYSSHVPGTTNGTVFALENLFDHLDSDKRNTFHWGPRQYETLSDTVRTSLNSGSFNVSNLTSADYIKGRMHHWLKRAGTNVPGVTLSFRREQSPDGTTQGQLKWFDHSGKGSGVRDEEGTMIEPRFVAWKLPNGECRFRYAEHNGYGHPTRMVETYTSSSGGCDLRTNEFEYASNGIDLTRQVQWIGAVTKQVSSNVFNSAHQVLTNFNALGEPTIFTYNAKAQLLSLKTPGGLTKTNIYESSGTWSNFLAKRIDLEIQRTNSMTYSNGNLFAHTDENGLTRTHLWDGLGRRIQALYPDGTAKTYVYSNLNLVAITNRLNQAKRYGYNGFRQRTERIDTGDNTNSYTYCSCGTPETFTDALGNTTTYIHDQAGRRCATLHPGGYSVTNNCDLMGQVTNVIDSAGHSVTNWYNNQGQVCVVSNAFGCQQMVKFDIEDHVIERIDANGVSTGFTYDDLGRQTVVTNGLGTIATFTYSSLGLITQTNQMTNYTGFLYDTAGRKIAETNANGEATQFRYDASGNLTNLIDAKGQNTYWAFDQFGRVIEKKDAAGSVIFTYAYDANGRLTNRWTPAKLNTRYVYDAGGNLTTIDYATSTNVSMEYDANHRLTRMVDSVGTTDYAYTDFGALLSEDGPWADDTVSYSYTSNRLRSQVSLLQPNASTWVQTYAYDDTKRLTEISSPAGTFGYSYDSERQMLVRRLSLSGGSWITNVYDGLGRLTSTALQNSSGSVLNSHAYFHDDGSRRTRQTRTGGDYVDYGYDRIGQLKSADGKEPGGTTNRWHERLAYAYDAAGNLSNRVQNVQTNVFHVDVLNQLTSVVRTNSSTTVAGTTTSAATNVTVSANGGAATAATRYTDATFARTNVSLVNGTNTFTAIAQDSLGRAGTNTSSVYLPVAVTFRYDQNGNLRTNGTRIFEYDDENQLTRITEPNAWKSEFSYDGKMRRRVRTEWTWQNGGWVQTDEVRYVYDGKLVMQERDQFNLPKVTYTRGRDLSGSLEGAGGIGGLLALSQPSTLNSQHSYYHADGNGNVTCLADTNQAVVARYLYDPFGNTLSATGPMAEANLYRFSSKELHVASGLIYYLYRFYVPSLQRWLNRDPISENGFLNLSSSRFGTTRNRSELNLFVFVRNRSADLVDGLGLADVGPLGGTCCNNSSGNEWGLVGGGLWIPLPPGSCTGLLDDCDGLTCGGGFYWVGNLNFGTCATPGCDSSPFDNRRWTPNGSDADGRPPGGPGGRGSTQGNTPPGYTYGPRPACACLNPRSGATH